MPETERLTEPAEPLVQPRSSAAAPHRRQGDDRAVNRLGGHDRHDVR